MLAREEQEELEELLEHEMEREREYGQFCALQGRRTTDRRGRRRFFFASGPDLGASPRHLSLSCILDRLVALKNDVTVRLEIHQA